MQGGRPSRIVHLYNYGYTDLWRLAAEIHTVQGPPLFSLDHLQGPQILPSPPLQSIHTQTSAHLQRGRHKEVLLLQPQLLALIGAVVRVEHTAQRLGTLLGQDGGHVVTWGG